MDRSCESCEFSEPRLLPTGVPVLDCRRYPPVPTWLHDENELLMVTAQVHEGDWCGEWRPNRSES